MHFLIVQWSVLAAWILTISSIYALIYLIGNYRASIRRPIFVSDNSLILRSGILSECLIPYNIIEEILITSKSLAENEKHIKMNFLSSHNVVLRLKNNCESIHFYGIKKKARVITLFVDEKASFEKLLNERITDFSD